MLPIAVGTDGTVSTATDAKIVNNSFGAVKVNSVSIEAAQGWNLTAFGDKATLAKEKVDSNKFGFQIALGNGEKKLTDNKNASKQTLLDTAVEGCYMSGVGDTSANSIGIAYDAIVTPGFRGRHEHRHRKRTLHHRLGCGLIQLSTAKGTPCAFPYLILQDKEDFKMKWKRILAMILAVASCLSLAVSASAANTVTRKATDFKDYDRTAWYAEAVSAGRG